MALGCDYNTWNDTHDNYSNLFHLGTKLDQKEQRQLGHHFLPIHLSLHWTWVVIITHDMILISHFIPFDNNIGPEGAKAIGTSLCNNSSLTSLYLICDYNIWYDVFNYNHISFHFITILDQKEQRQLGHHFLPIHPSLHCTWVVIKIYDMIFMIKITYYFIW